jgi:hypothetical protein
MTDYILDEFFDEGESFPGFTDEGKAAIHQSLIQVAHQACNRLARLAAAVVEEEKRATLLSGVRDHEDSA